MKHLLSGLLAAGALFGAVAANAQTFRYGVDPDGVGPAGFGATVFDSFGAASFLRTQSAAPVSIFNAAGSNINLANYDVFSNQNTQPGDAGVINATYTVRISLDLANLVTSTDFVDFAVPISITPSAFFFDGVTGSGNSVLLNQAFLAGTTFMGISSGSGTPISLNFRSYDELDALEDDAGAFADLNQNSVVDPGETFAASNDFDFRGVNSSITFRVTTVPEPGSVAMMVGMGASGLLLAVRRRR